MRSRSVWNTSAISLLGLGLGLAAGAAAGLLAAPRRGADLRRSLRPMRRSADSNMQRRDTVLSTPGSAPMTATLGEIAQMHSGDELSPFEARS